MISAIFLIGAIFSSLQPAFNQKPMTGGLSDERPADEHVKAIVSQLKPDFLAKSGLNGVDQFDAISVASQVVAGTNYFVKVQLGPDQFAHLRIFQPLPYTGNPPELTSFQLDKTQSDLITYF